MTKIVFFYLIFIVIYNENFTKIRNNYKLKACSSVDRASDSDSESQGFDSLHAYGLRLKLLTLIVQLMGLFWFRHLKLVKV